MTGPLLNLASRAFGAGVVAASDEAFGEKEHLLIDAPADFTPGRYSMRGEIVDGWETRRRRTPGNDWAIVRLGVPGVIASVDIDTSFFTGNFPATCRVEACGVEGHPSPEALTGPDTRWSEIVAEQPLTGDAHHVVPVTDPARYTHVRLSIMPDGGVARLRVVGRAVPDPAWFDGLTPDLAAGELGAVVEACSDAFYTHPSVLTLPGPPRTMGEGWETRRRRGPGHDWVVLKLAAVGAPRLLEVDTTCYVYNASSHVALFGAGPQTGPLDADAAEPSLRWDDPAWRPIVPLTPLQPDTRHRFVLDPEVAGEVARVRLDVHPDGGLSRLRLWGTVTPVGRRALGWEWWSTLPIAQVAQVLAQRCALGEDRALALAAAFAAARPFADVEAALAVLKATASLTEGERAAVRAVVVGD